MTMILEGLEGTTCVAYLDDVCIFSDSIEQHLKDVKTVLDRFKHFNLKLNLAKCSIAKEEINFLGHKISSRGIQPSFDKVETIQNWTPPQKLSEVRQFVGLASYYRAHVSNFATIWQPLTDLTRKSVSFKWGKSQEEAFEELNKQITSATVLTPPDLKIPFTLTTDASTQGWGAVLAQKEDRPVAFASGRWSVTEQNYQTTELELFALIKGIQKFEHYLAGQKFTAYTDHLSLKWLKSMKINSLKNSRRLTRWIEYLSLFQFDIIHKPGSQIAHADALSRKTCRIINEREIDLQTASLQDPNLSIIYNLLSGNQSLEDLEATSDELQYYLSELDLLFLEDGYIKRQNNQPEQPQIIVPEVLRQKVMELAHSHPCAGHLGIKRTIARITTDYFWYRLNYDVQKFIRMCRPCSINKHKTQKNQEGMTPITTTGKAFKQLSADILGPLPTTAQGNKYILVISDLCTKWVEVIPIPDQTAVTTAWKFVEVIARYGIPDEILTDQGRNFESELIQELCHLLKIKKLRTSGYRPQTNGQTERFNNTLCTMLRHLINDQQDDWDQWCHLAAFAYRTSVHSTTKLTPFELVFGRKPSTPVTQELQIKKKMKSVSYQEILKIVEANLKSSMALARQNISKAQDLTRVHGDGAYKVGDKVLVKNHSVKPGLAPKLSPKYKPEVWIIKEKRTPLYMIQRNKTKRWVHGNNLKKVQYDNLEQEDDPSDSNESDFCDGSARSEKPIWDICAECDVDDMIITDDEVTTSRSGRPIRAPNRLNL